ncbi:hypothetical protein BIV57_18060 [Mangrovactinospora gilvigrisea]|uniref:Uncharacterized protein n=1 Tax=Mangrovactinospora gilvigrisea TaxID=1428644 RepID=A0A1J7BRN5_9ACTN|nr:hypothetical protein BIV57_18060 [Mangrovactinospora gilvigrisea]
MGVAGQAAAWQNPGEMASHLALCAQTPEVRGNIYFSAKDVRADRLGAMSLVVKEYYQKRVLPDFARR